MLFLLSPICFGATPELKKQFEKIIAECISGIAETVLEFTTR